MATDDSFRAARIVVDVDAAVRSINRFLRLMEQAKDSYAKRGVMYHDGYGELPTAPLPNTPRELHANCRCMLVPVLSDDAKRQANRELLADCLSCDPDLIDDVVAVWAKR